jgi:hypothetical protein
MRLRSVLFIFSPVLFLWIPAASAQKRVFATVNPNTTALNKSADIYDPLTGIISPAAQTMTVARERHVALRVAGGKVLIAGGYNNHPLNSAELFNPANGSFSITGEMLIARSDAAAVLLANGGAFIVGGYNGSYLNTAEVYDPVTATFSYISSQMTTARQIPGAVLLADGNVLITGGFNGGAFLADAELFDPIARGFTPTRTLNPTDGTVTSTNLMKEARAGHTSTALPDGKVLIAGGCNNAQSGELVCNNILASAEIYDPATETFTLVGSMVTARKDHTAVILSNGKVLIAGGTNASGALAAAELYDPATQTFSGTGSMGTARIGHTTSILTSGKVLITGGKSDQYLNSAELYDPATGIFSTLASSLSVPRFQQSATVLSDGKVLIAGGQNSALAIFDINSQSQGDNIAPNIVISSDSQLGYVPYAGSGLVLVFSPITGEVIDRIVTGGKPAWITPFANGQKLAVVSVLDNKVFIIDTNTRSLQATYSFTGTFGFGSRLELSPDGNTGYISSTATGEVLKFNIATGNELGRLRNLQSPAQITVTRDGSTLLIVDTVANNVTIADSSSMTVKNRMDPLPKYSIASFTIFSRAVLNADESIAIITSQDSNETVALSGAFVFDSSTGELVDNGNDNSGIYAVGTLPNYTLLMPDGKNWLVLSRNYLSLVPTVHSGDNSGITEPVVTHYSLATGTPMGSANIVLSTDARYAFYTSASTDRVFQHDVQTGGVVGSYAVGDNPNLSIDQASSLAATPDGKTLVVLNLASNELDLLTDNTIFRQTKYISQQDRFTGVSIVNLSASSVDVKITAMTDAGATYDDGSDVIVNPAVVPLAPNAQKSVDVSELFNLNNDKANAGYLIIESEHPVIVGNSATGQIQSSFLSSFIRNMEEMPFYSGIQNQLHNWILPEIPQTSTSSSELNFVNPNYNASTYTVTHFGTDGTELEIQDSKSLNDSGHTATDITGDVSSTSKGQVLITGGFASTKTSGTAELYDSASISFFSPVRMQMARHGHTSVLLQNGKVLVSGGKNGFTILKSAELFNPASKTFTFTPGSMNAERYRNTATLLMSGKVLLAGGQNSVSINQTAELYDPVADRFVLTRGRMSVPRDAHTATRLTDGRILLIGGLDGVAASATAEIYNPANDSFVETGSLHVARAFHTAVLLEDGKVLVAGGYNGSYLASAELYDPQTGIFSLISSMTEARSNHSATALSDGTVLIAGGANSSDSTIYGALKTAELYDPLTGLFSQINGRMSAYRSSHTATLLLDDVDGINNQVIIAGGYGLDVSSITTDAAETALKIGALTSGDVYDPAKGLFTKVYSNLSVSREGHSAVLLQSGVPSGYLRVNSQVGLLSTEIYSNGGATTAIKGIDVDKHVGITRIYSPRFVISTERLTLLNVINANQDSEASVGVTLFASNGSVLATKTRLLPKNGQLRGNLWDIFSNDPGLQNQEGWLEVTSTVDQIVGTLSFTDLNNKYLVSFELSAFPMSSFVFPLISEDADFMTEISLLNSGNQSATVQLELWGLAGTLDGSKTITLGPQTQMSQILSEIFPGMQPHRSGNVRIHSSQPIYGMGELSARSLRFVSSVQPVAYPEQ